MIGISSIPSTQMAQIWPTGLDFRTGHGLSSKPNLGYFQIWIVSGPAAMFSCCVTWPDSNVQPDTTPTVDMLPPLNTKDLERLLPAQCAIADIFEVNARMVWEN